MQQSEESFKVLVVFSCVSALIAVIMLFLFYRFTKIKNEILKEKLKEKLDNEVLINRAELLALRSQMNPHFVFNALNTVLYFIQQNDIPQSEEFLAKFSHLVRNFFEYSRKKDLSLQEELDFITHYLEIEKLRFEDKLNYTITVDENIDTENTRVPSMIIQPIVENAINHGIFHKSGNGNIRISFKEIHDTSYQITILDDGIGIKKSKELYKDSKRQLYSKSTDVLEERLKLLKDGRQWKIDYTIEDLAEINPKESGTKVTLTIEAL